MFAAQNIDVTHCPFSAGAIHIGDYSLHLPKLPSGLGALASLAKVSSIGLVAIEIVVHHDNKSV